MQAALGVGFGSGADANELLQLANDVLAAGKLTASDLACIATLDTKRDAAPLNEFAKALRTPVRFFDADSLSRETARIANPSARVQDAVGTPSVAEAAALLAAGERATLLVTKRARGHCTAALAISTSRLMKVVAS